MSLLISSTIYIKNSLCQTYCAVRRVSRLLGLPIVIGGCIGVVLRSYPHICLPAAGLMMAGLTIRHASSYLKIQNIFTKFVSVDTGLNSSHFNYSGQLQGITEPPPEVTLEMLRDLSIDCHDKFVKECPDCSPPFLIEDIKFIIQRIQAKRYFDSVPLKKSNREDWFINLDRTLRNITHQLLIRKERGDYDAIYFSLATLSEMSRWCGSQYKVTTIQILLRLKAEPPKTIEEEAQYKIVEFRNFCIQKASSPMIAFFGEDVNPHVLNEAVYRTSQLIKLPGSETASLDFGVMGYHPWAFINPMYLPNKFFSFYTVKNLVSYFDELINGILPDGRKSDVQLKRESMIDWFRSQIAEYLHTDDPEIILDQMLSHVLERNDNSRSNALKKEAIEYFLFKIGVLLQRTPHLSPEDEFLHMQENS